MPSGVIKKLVSDRGFGFIRGEREEIFFHVSALEGVTFEELQEGQTVDFEVDSSEEPRGRNKGPRASVVRPG
jgi:CspA family cold shock protein